MSEILDVNAGSGRTENCISLQEAQPRRLPHTGRVKYNIAEVMHAEIVLAARRLRLRGRSTRCVQRDTLHTDLHWCVSSAASRVTARIQRFSNIPSVPRLTTPHLVKRSAH